MLAFHFPPYLRLKKNYQSNSSHPHPVSAKCRLQIQYHISSFHVEKDSSLLNKINHFCDCQSDLFELGKFKVKM